jgi:hypothetical protein
MAYFDGRISSIEPMFSQTNTELNKLRLELDALHAFFDRMGIEKWDHQRGGELLLAQRLEKMLEAPTLWEPVKKESEQGG